MESEKIRVLLIDDHVVFRKAVIRVLEKLDNLVVIGQASYYKDALEILRTVPCDLVLLDFELNDRSGLEVIEIAKSEGIEPKFIILSGHMGQAYVRRSLEAGARGYVLKDSPVDILEGIRSVLNDEIYISRGLRDA